MGEIEKLHNAIQDVPASYETHYNQIIDLHVERQQLERSYHHANVQVNRWSCLSLIASIFSFVLLNIWIIATLLGFSPYYMNFVSAIPPLLTNLVNGLFLVQLRSANKRMDAIRNELAEMVRFSASLDAVTEISDSSARNEMIMNIVCQMIRSRLPERQTGSRGLSKQTSRDMTGRTPIN